MTCSFQKSLPLLSGAFVSFIFASFWRRLPTLTITYDEDGTVAALTAVFGYDRIEDENIIALMNEIYRDYWNPLNNFFLPSMKLKEKERNGARITKRYDLPMTPYQRLMLAPNLSEQKKQELTNRFKSLNPFVLKEGLEKKLELFFSLLRQMKLEKKAA